MFLFIFVLLFSLRPGPLGPVRGRGRPKRRVSHQVRQDARWLAVPPTGAASEPISCRQADLFAGALTLMGGEVRGW